MLVQCPKCKTKYRVSDDVVKDALPAFRCSRCKHTFELEMREIPEPVVREEKLADASAAENAQERELSFTFPPPKEPVRDEETFSDAPAAKADASMDRETLQDSWSISIPETKSEKPFVISPDESLEVQIGSASEQRPNENIEPRASGSPLQSTSNIYDMEPHREQRASIAPFLTLFILFIVSFAFATAYHEVHPQASEGIVKNIPLLGASVLKNDHLRRRVLLQSLQANYQTIQGNREVFVVSGVAVNENPVVIREVRIAGQVYNQEGKEIEQQTIWVGNAISPKIVRGMSAQDISDLQRLKPLKTFEIPPGDSVPFTIVFLKQNKEARNFSCEIVSADGAV